MNDAFKKVKKGIQYVLDNYTSYRVAKDLGINNRTINRYQNGETLIENMTLGTAEKIYNYYLKEKDKMTVLEYSGMDYKEGIVDVDFEVENFDDVLSSYSRIKYSDKDLEQRPNSEVMIHELSKDLGSTLEDALENGDERLVIGYSNADTRNNDFISFDYKVSDIDEMDEITVKISLHDSWSESQ